MENSIEKYNAWLKKLKRELKAGDKIDVIGSGTKLIVAKYPNFVLCLSGGYREAIQYTEIQKVVSRGEA